MHASKTALQSLEAYRKIFDDYAHQKIFDILSEHILRAESISPAAGDLMIRRLMGDTFSSSKTVSFHRDHLTDLLKTFADENCVALVQEAIDLAGLRGKITIARSSSKNDVVELTKGYLFEDLCSSFGQNSLELSTPKVLCIDGYIESVSEIHHLLTSLSETKETCVLFVRGLSDEVLHTLRLNFDRKTVICVPIVVKFDIDGANLLNDIAVIAGNDVVSSFKGQTISSIDLFFQKSVDSIKISGKTTSIVNKSSHDRVDRHIQHLQKKILSAENSASVEALTKRIKRLGSNQVNIHLSDDHMFLKRSLMIDRCIRSLKCTNNGIVCLDQKVYLNSSVAASKLYADKFNKVINDIGCIVH